MTKSYTYVCEICDKEFEDINMNEHATEHLDEGKVPTFKRKDMVERPN